MTTSRRTFLALLLACAAAAGCKNNGTSTKAGLRTVDVTVGSKTLTLEVADTDETRQTGLMRRDSMPRDHGMLFVFPDEETRGFFMKNTRIPLDIIFLDAAGKVDSVKSMKPYDLSSTLSDGPAKYAIELNGGMAAKAGVAKGQVIELPAGAREIKQ